MSTSINTIQNPLVIITFFASVVQVSSIIILPFLHEENQRLFIYFLIFFSTILIVFLAFMIVKKLYVSSPMIQNGKPLTTDVNTDSSSSQLSINNIIEIKETLFDIKTLLLERNNQIRFLQSRILIFWSKEGSISYDVASTIKNKLIQQGAFVEVLEHSSPEPPDSIWISEYASAEIVNIVMSSMDYIPEYIFPVNYPSKEAGALSQFVLSVGLRSNFRYKKTANTETPYKISQGEVEFLLNLPQEEKEFKAKLYQIAPPR